MANLPSFLGTVQDVRGGTISVALDQDTVVGLVFIGGQGYRIGQIGSFVRIPIGLTDLFGIVSQVGAGSIPERLMLDQPYGHRWLTVQLIGESSQSGEFHRGVSQYPIIGDEAHLVTRDRFAEIYGHANEPQFVRIGSLAGAQEIPAMVDANLLVTRHSAVVGTTGSGKSTTVARLVDALSANDQFPAARILILDVHGEYRTALSDRSTVFRVNGTDSSDEQPLYVPYWALSFDELLKVTPFDGVNDTERVAIAEKIRGLKLSSLKKHARDGVDADTLTVDSPVPFSIHRLWYELHRLICSTHTAQPQNQDDTTEAIEFDEDGQPICGDIMRVVPPRYRPITRGGPDRVYLSGSPLNIRRQIMATGSILRDSRYDFLFRPGPWCPQPGFGKLDAQPTQDLDELLKSWLGSDKPISILDLSGVPTSILTDLIGVVVRLLFDALFWARELPEGGRSRPLLFVFEEAHTYLNAGNANAASASVRRVVKEGRKYGVSAMVVSQRPSEIDPTILSQCGTTFALRLSNSTDRSHVQAAVSDNMDGLLSMLPVLRTGEVIVVGESVKLPLRAMIDVPAENRRPDSEDPKVFSVNSRTGWNRELKDEDYAKVIEKWRSENATSVKERTDVNSQNACGIEQPSVGRI